MAKTKRTKRIQLMIDEMIAEELDANLDDGATDCIVGVLTNGCTGYAQMTDKEVEREYLERKSEQWAEDLDWMAHEWGVLVAEEGTRKARKRFRELRQKLLDAGHKVADK